MSQDIRDRTRYCIRYVTLGCLVRWNVSLQEGFGVQYFRRLCGAVSRCPCEHASQRRVLLFRPQPSQVSEHASVQDYPWHGHRRSRGHHISCASGPSCCPRDLPFNQALGWGPGMGIGRPARLRPARADASIGLPPRRVGGRGPSEGGSFRKCIACTFYWRS